MDDAGSGVAISGSGYPMEGEGYGEVVVVSLEVIGMVINVPPLSGQQIMDRAYGYYGVAIMVVDIFLKVSGFFVDRRGELTLVRLEV